MPYCSLAQSCSNAPAAFTCSWLRRSRSKDIARYRQTFWTSSSRSGPSGKALRRPAETLHGAHTADLQRALSLGFMAALSLEVAKAGLQVIVRFEDA